MSHTKNNKALNKAWIRTIYLLMFSKVEIFVLMIVGGKKGLKINLTALSLSFFVYTQAYFRLNKINIHFNFLKIIKFGH